MQRGSGRRRGRPPLSEGPSSRSLILESALELFSKQGYDTTSLKEIAGKVGIRDSAIYAHFPSKAAIREELFQSFGPHAVRVEWRAADLGQALVNPRGFVKGLLDRLAQRWMDPRERMFFRFLLIENLHGGGDSSLVNIKDIQAQMRGELRKVAVTLMGMGLLRKMDVDWLVGQFLAPIMALRIEVAFSPAEPDLARVRAQLDKHVDQYFIAFGMGRTQAEST